MSHMHSRLATAKRDKFNDLARHQYNRELTGVSAGAERGVSFVNS